MKRILTIALVLALILSLSGSVMAAKDKSNRGKPESDVFTVDAVDSSTVLQDTGDDGDEDVLGVEEDGDEAEVDLDDGLSQGTVHCDLVIDYTIPGSGSGTMVLVATRGEQVESFTAEIPWGLTDEEAMAFISSAFEPLVEEAFGIEVNSFKVTEYEFNEETAVTTVTLLAIHGKAPIKMMPPGKGNIHRSTETFTHMFTHTERHAVKAKKK